MIPKDCGPGKELWGLLCYPKCKQGFSPFLCCLCRPPVPDCKKLGMNPGIDLSCAKKIEIGSPHIGICKPGKEIQLGRCYPYCKKGYSGVGPVCWGSAPWVDGVKWTDCGMAAGKDAITCGKVIGNQVLSTFSSILSLVSFGAAGAITKGAKAVQAAVKVAKVVQKGLKVGLDCGLTIADSVEQKNIVGGAISAATTCIGGAISVGKAAKGLEKGAEAVADVAKAGAKEAEKVAGEVAKDAAKGASKATSNVKKYTKLFADTAKGANDIIQSAEDEDNVVDTVREALDLAGNIDPTGLVSVAASFTFPKCNDVEGASFSAPTPPPTPVVQGFVMGQVIEQDDIGIPKACAEEGDVCTCLDGSIKMGNQGFYTSYRQPEPITGKISCTKDVFGDDTRIAAGVKRICYCTQNEKTKEMQDFSQYNCSPTACREDYNQWLQEQKEEVKSNQTKIEDNAKKQGNEAQEKEKTVRTNDENERKTQDSQNAEALKKAEAEKDKKQ